MLTVVCLSRFNIPTFKPKNFFPKRQIAIASLVVATLLCIFGERKCNVFEEFSIEYFQGLGRTSLMQKRFGFFFFFFFKVFEKISKGYHFSFHEPLQLTTPKMHGQ